MNLLAHKSVWRRAIGLAAGLSALSGGEALAQTWGLAPSTDVVLPTKAVYNLNCSGGPIPPCCEETTACGPISSAAGMFIDLLGWNRWWESIALCKDDLGDCGFMKARGEAVVRLRGLGSSSVLLRWDALALTKERCDNAPGLYYGNATATIVATVDLTIDGVAPGTPVTVFFRWRQASTNSYSPEAGTEDSLTAVSGGSLTIFSSAGFDPQFDLDFDLVDLKGGRFSGDIYGSFVAEAGTTVTILTDVALESTIRDPAEPIPGSFQHRQCNSEMDRETVAWSGEIELSLGSAVPPPPGSYEGPPGEPEPEPDLLFSVDLGGDAELADPTPDGNEVFDPGDAYPWMGPPLPPGGADGVLDDAVILGGFDPTPDPTIPFANDACLNTAPPPPAYFDLDDIDLTDIPLSSMIPVATPLPAPIPRFPSAYIHRLEYSVISFEDDGPEKFDVSFFAGLPYCSVPVGSTSGGVFTAATTYGKTTTEDEVEQMTWIPGALLPYPVGATLPGLDEMSLHTDLAPNPDFGEIPDDDTDALDIIADGSDPTIAYVYLTSDHEATGPLLVPPPSPGGVVFEHTPGGPTLPMIYPSIHLGLPDTVDIRALEFVWLAEGPAGEALAMIFSVAPDDPGTFGIDESAGLDPALLYYSFLTGSYADLVAFPFDDPVDAFSNYRRALIADPVTPPPPGPCPGDANGDGVVNFADITSVLANFGTVYPPGILTGPGDADHDGDVDFADITSVLSHWLLPC